MMKYGKKWISCLLVLVLAFAMGSTAFATAAARCGDLPAGDHEGDHGALRAWTGGQKHRILCRKAERTIPVLYGERGFCGHDHLVKSIKCF